jgi:nucleoside-diphosphate-sugar epimerase
MQPETISTYLMNRRQSPLRRNANINSGAVSPRPAGKQQEERFVTGATGFIGTELVKQLIQAGHQVRGLARSDAGMEQLQAAGAEPHRGDLEDLDSLRAGATGMDVVVNLAFNHDFSKFAQNAKDEMSAIEALGSVLEPGKLFIVTSGTGLASGGPGHLRTEQDPPQTNTAIPRNPELDDTHKQGLIPYFTQIARDKGISAYVGDGANRFAAAPLQDVAHLYRLAIEKTGPGFTVYHAVQEEGVAIRAIAETIGTGLKVPVISLAPEQAAEHFGWLAHFAALDMPASSAWTRKTLNWNPTGPGLIEDLTNMKY